MSKVFVVMPYSDPYEEIYSKILRPILIDAGMTVVRGDDIKASSDIRKDVEEGISEADLVVIEVSEHNPNVYFEFGLAAAEGKELLIVAEEGSKLPFDTRRWRHLFYDRSNFDLFEDEFTLWLEQTSAYRGHEQKASIKTLDRGNLLSDIVDAAFYIDGSDFDCVDTQIWRDVRSGTLLPCWYSYYTDVGTGTWLKLCQDPLYTAIRESVSTLTTNVDRIIEAIGSSFISNPPDFISLGPGNGQKDRVLLKGIANKLVSTGSDLDLYYYPVDINTRMLSAATRAVCEDPDLSDRLKVKVVKGNFEDIAVFRPVFDYRNAPNIFSFLGNTLGNVSNEINLLKNIKNAMQPEDVLLLELRSNTAETKLGRDHFSLIFAPLQRLGVTYDQNKFEVRQLGSFSQVPGTTTTSVHYVNAEIRGESIGEVTLSCVNFYDRESMRQVLEAPPLSFSVIDVIDSKKLVTFILKNSL